MTGTPPEVTLRADKPTYTEGETVTVSVAVTDPDTYTAVVTGSDAAGTPTTVTTSAVDSAVVSSAFWTASGEPARVTGLTATGIAHRGSGPLQVTVVDAQGNRVVRSITITVTSATVYGSDRTPIDLAVYPKLGYTRLYGPAGMPSSAALNRVPISVYLPHLSYKGTTNPSAVSATLDTLTRPIVLESLHEMDRAVTNGGPAPAAYKADYKVLTDTVRGHKNGHLVLLAQTFMRYQQAKLTRTRPWEDFWTGDADLIGFDCEWDSSFKTMGKGGYPDPEAFFAPCVAAAKTTGKPLVIPELGWPQISTDTDGSGLAAWYTACAAYLASVEALAVAAYDSPGQTSPTGTYVLTGKALIAWQAVTAAQH